MSEALNIDEAVLDAISQPEQMMLLYRERIDPQLVLDKDIRGIYEWAFEWVNAKHEAPTPEMVLTEYPGLAFEEPKCNIEWLIDKLRERHIRNQLKPVLRDASKQLADDPFETLRYLAASATNVVAETRTRNIEIDVTDWDDAMARYSKRVREGQLNGITTGFHEIDEALGGYRHGTLNINLARPKRFKTWIMLQGAVAAQFANKQAVLLTPELNKEEMFDRYLCMMAGIPYGLFMRGQLMTEHYNALNEAREVALGLEKGLKIIRPPAGQRSVAQVVDIAGEMGAEILYIDGLKYMETTKSFKPDQKWLEVGTVAEELKEASEYFPIVAAAQFNREAASLTEMADLSKIGMSDIIGQVADLLMGVYANKDMLQNRIIEYGVVDSRSTDIRSWHMDVKVATHSCLQVREPVIR